MLLLRKNIKQRKDSRTLLSGALENVPANTVVGTRRVGLDERDRDLSRARRPIKKVKRAS